MDTTDGHRLLTTILGFPDGLSKRNTLLMRSMNKKPHRSAAFLCWRHLQPVNDDVQAQPHHINEVPVPRGALKREMMIRGEMTFEHTV